MPTACPRISYTHLLMTTMVFPYARSPYGSSLLYTPACSSVFTTARGVQGMMDLNVPGGGVSVLEWSGALSVDKVIVDEVSERGSMKRMLRCRVSFLSERDWGASTRVRGNDGECKFNVLVV